MRKSIGTPIYTGGWCVKSIHTNLYYSIVGRPLVHASEAKAIN
ncbi:MAG: hypothetical protein ABI716_00175 [Candidatus Saccharibacteria bacterium]